MKWLMIIATLLLTANVFASECVKCHSDAGRTPAGIVVEHTGSVTITAKEARKKAKNAITTAKAARAVEFKAAIEERIETAANNGKVSVRIEIPSILDGDPLIREIELSLKLRGFKAGSDVGLWTGFLTVDWSQQ